MIRGIINGEYPSVYCSPPFISTKQNTESHAFMSVYPVSWIQQQCDDTLLNRFLVFNIDFQPKLCLTYINGMKEGEDGLFWK